MRDQEERRRGGAGGQSDEAESEVDMGEEEILDVAEECFKRINDSLESYSLTIV